MLHGPSLDYQDSYTPLKFYGQIKDNNNNHKTKKKWNSVQKQRSNVRILIYQTWAIQCVDFISKCSHSILPCKLCNIQ